MGGLLIRWKGLLAAGALTALPCPAAAAERPPGQWAEAAVDDLHFIRATLRENHPGPRDEANPAFRDWYVRGFEEALALARGAESFPGYFFAIQKYGVGFQDGHLGAMADDRFADAARIERRWPGFVLGYDRGRFRVVETSPRHPPAGAELEECDGRAADALADEILRPFYNLWSVRGARPRQAPFLLIDERNPFVRRPAECTFVAGGRREKVRLQWAPIANDDLAPKVQAAQGRFAMETGIRRFGPNGWWISLASFNANSDAASEPLLQVMRALEERPRDFRDADTIVFDVRGNSGGNSAFGTRIAQALWGAGFVASAPRAEAVDWRVSPTNVRMVSVTNLQALERRFGADDPRVRAYAAFAEELKAALERGDTFYRQKVEEDRATASGPPEPVRARIFLLTDGWCASACLDFADLALAAPGVVHVGAETSADTIYIDNTAARLPSGEGWLGWSMKVFRGRPRGHNQSHVPDHVWNGSMADTAGLERWIAGLAHSR